MNTTSLNELEQSIIARSEHRGIHVDIEKIRYSIHEFYKGVPNAYRRKALYVGVGHGQDALLALLEGLVDNVVGVDPYEGGGNDEKDYRDLVSLISTYHLEERFLVHKGTIEEYLHQDGMPVDVVVCCDVLHHIFETEAPLRQSDCYDSAVELFHQMNKACNEEGMLMISDVQRGGLRPYLAKRGKINTPVNYRTKQNWEEWNAAAVEAGWTLKRKEVYIPYAFRKMGWLWCHPLGLYTLCDRYFLYYEK